MKVTSSVAFHWLDSATAKAMAEFISAGGQVRYGTLGPGDIVVDPHLSQMENEAALRPSGATYAM